MRPQKPHEPHHIDERDNGFSQRKTGSFDFNRSKNGRYDLRERVALNQLSAPPNAESVACPFGSPATWDSSPGSSPPPKSRRKRYRTVGPADPAITTKTAATVTAATASTTTARKIEASVERFRAFLITGGVLNNSDKKFAAEIIANDPIVSYVVRIASMLKEGTVKGFQFIKLGCASRESCLTLILNAFFKTIGFLQCRTRYRVAANGGKMRDRRSFKALLGN